MVMVKFYDWSRFGHIFMNYFDDLPVYIITNPDVAVDNRVLFCELKKDIVYYLLYLAYRIMLSWICLSSYGNYWIQGNSIHYCYPLVVPVRTSWESLRHSHLHLCIACSHRCNLYRDPSHKGWKASNRRIICHTWKFSAYLLCSACGILRIYDSINEMPFICWVVVNSHIALCTYIYNKNILNINGAPHLNRSI